MVLKPESIRSRHKQKQCLWKPTPWFLDGHFSRTSSRRRSKGALWCLFIRAPITLTRTAPELPDHPPKAPPPDPITLGIRISYGILGDTNIHPIAPTVLQRGHYSTEEIPQSQRSKHRQVIFKICHQIQFHICLFMGGSRRKDSL